MGEHRLASDVANGINAGHGGAASIVNLDERTVHIQNQIIQPKSLCLRRPANRDEHFLGRNLHRLGAARFSGQHAIRERGRVGLQMQVYLQRFQPGQDRLGQRRVIDWQDAIFTLDNGDFRAEFGIGNAKFQTDIARANHGQRGGNCLQRQGFS